MEAVVHAWVVAASGVAASRVQWANQPDVARPADPGAWLSLRLIADASPGPGWLERAANPLVVDDAVEGVDAGADTLTLTAHGLLTGDGPIRLTTTGTLPGGLATATDYWVIRVSANAIQLAATFLGAVEDPTPIDITSSGSGVHTLADVAAAAGSLGTVRAGAEVTVTAQGTRTSTLSVQCFGGAAAGATSARAILERLKARTLLPSIAAALRAGDVGVGQLGAIRDVSARLSTGAFEPRAVMEATIHLLAPTQAEAGTVIDTITATGDVT